MLYIMSVHVECGQNLRAQAKPCPVKEIYNAEQDKTWCGCGSAYLARLALNVRAIWAFEAEHQDVQVRLLC